MASNCPNCKVGNVTAFFESAPAPVNSVVLVKDRKSALEFRTAPLRLGVCGNCAFIHNMDFSADAVSYDLGYESTQAYSPTFRKFQHSVVHRLFDQYGLKGAHAIEVGCAQGEFLELLRLSGVGSAIGYDPAFDATRPAFQVSEKFQVVPEYFGAGKSVRSSDFLACLMTIEHVFETGEFMNSIVEAIDPDGNPLVYIQAPNAEKVLTDGAFWDIYYEHCSYFTAPSLTRLMRQSGLCVLDVRTEYDDQYLSVDARLEMSGAEQVDDSASVAAVLKQVDAFRLRTEEVLSGWRDFIARASELNEKVVLWGGGSKAVAFLTALNNPANIEHATALKN